VRQRVRLVHQIIKLIKAVRWLIRVDYLDYLAFAYWPHGTLGRCRFDLFDTRLRRSSMLRSGCLPLFGRRIFVHRAKQEGHGTGGLGLPLRHTLNKKFRSAVQTQSQHLISTPRKSGVLAARSRRCGAASEWQLTFLFRDAPICRPAPTMPSFPAI
jgi:hypothetical protein